MDRLCCPICFGGYRGSACSGHLETTALSSRKATCRPGFFDFPASRLRVLWIGSIRLASLISALRVVRAVVDGAYQSLVQRVCQVRQLGTVESVCRVDGGSPCFHDVSGQCEGIRDSDSASFAKNEIHRRFAFGLARQRCQRPELGKRSNLCRGRTTRPRLYKSDYCLFLIRPAVWHVFLSIRSGSSDHRVRAGENHCRSGTK